MNLLEIRDLYTVLDTEHGVVRALEALSLTIERGETFAVVGESGCGKSMTALSILRLLPDNGRVERGSVDLGGTDLVQLPEARMRDVRGRRVSIIFQEPATSLNPVLRVGQQIAEVIERHSALRGAAARERALHWLTRVGLPQPEQRIDSYPFQLSGGQKQRVMIAIALAAEPGLLIADEPTTALDVTIQKQILDLLRELQREQGMAMLLITHDLAIVAEMAHRVALMYAGQIVEVAETAAFFAQPLHPYAQMLMAALPDTQARGRALAAIAGTVPALDRPFAGCRFVERCSVSMQRCSSTPVALLRPMPERDVRCLVYDAASDAGATMAAAAATAYRIALSVDDAAAVAAAALAAAADVAIDATALDSARGMRAIGDGREPAAMASAAPGAPARLAAGPVAVAGHGHVQHGAEPHAAEPPLLELIDYKVWFPIRKGLLRRTVGYFKAVDGISLQLQPGRTLALVGESGCGKTTTGKALLQLLRSIARIEGQALLAGQALDRLRGAELQLARRKAQIIFQDPFSSLDPRMRVAEILEEGVRALRPDIDRDQRQQRVATLLQKVGLRPESLGRYPHEFSGGQRQRLAIARALAVEPELIVCDEPTSALDVSVQAQILNLLAQLQRELGVAYLFITHNFGVVEYLAHDVAVMRGGKIVEQGPALQVLDDPHDDYTKTLLAAVPRLKRAA